jgi:hypothetical protein
LGTIDSLPSIKFLLKLYDISLKEMSEGKEGGGEKNEDEEEISTVDSFEVKLRSTSITQSDWSGLSLTLDEEGIDFNPEKIYKILTSIAIVCKTTGSFDFDKFIATLCVVPISKRDDHLCRSFVISPTIVSTNNFEVSNYTENYNQGLHKYLNYIERCSLKNSNNVEGNRHSIIKKFREVNTLKYYASIYPLVEETNTSSFGENIKIPQIYI